MERKEIEKAMQFIESWQMMPQKCVGFKYISGTRIAWFEKCNFVLALRFKNGNFHILGIPNMSMFYPIETELEKMSYFGGIDAIGQDLDEFFGITWYLTISDLMENIAFNMMQDYQDRTVYLSEVYKDALVEWVNYRKEGYPVSTEIETEEESISSFMKRCSDMECFKDAKFV